MTAASGTKTSTSQLLLVSLVLGLTAAAVFLAIRNWRNSQQKPEDVGYFDVRGEREDEPEVSASEAFDYEKLRDDPELRALDLDAHFEQVTLPGYHEAERFTLVQLGFELEEQG